MIDRKVVETVLLACDIGAETKIPAGPMLAELCRTWLAVQDAPEVTLTAGDDPETNEPCAEILDVFPSEWAGSRVRLVPDGDACIGGGEGK